MEQGLPEPVAVRLGPLGRYEVRVALFALALVLVGVPFGLLLHQVTTDGSLTVLDDSAARWLNRELHDDDVAIALLQAVSFTGKPIFLTFAVGLPGIWVLRHGGRKLAVFLAVTCIGGGIVGTIVKVAVGRPRPVVDEPITEAFGNSFPSGHAMQAVVCYGALLVVFLPLLRPALARAAVVVAAVWALAIGVSRLALGVHFVSDVLGGFVLGAAWLAGSIAAFEIWREERGRRPTRPLTEGIEPEEAEELVDSS
jgi:undecaprenyl-diphosphatase